MTVSKEKVLPSLPLRRASKTYFQMNFALHLKNSQNMIEMTSRDLLSFKEH
jgi:hypothetical protein